MLFYTAPTLANVNTQAFLDDSPSNEPLLITGRGSNNGERYWQCQVPNQSSAGVTNKTFPLRLWSNSQGFIGENKMSWNLTLEHLSIQTEHGQASLHSIEFLNSNIDNDTFTAISSEGELTRCALKGPGRLVSSDQLLFEDSSEPDSFLHNAGLTTWACNGRFDPISDYSVIEFDQSGSGTVNEETFKWYFDPEATLFILTNTSTKVVDNFQILAQSAGYRSFSGTVHGSAIECGTSL